MSTIPLSAPPIVLIHGAATTASVWDAVVAELHGLDVVAVDRPCTGDLAAELEWLAPRVRGALVVGVSGGATLGLALAASRVPLAGALLHEPAVGSLAPALLAGVAAAYAVGGVEGFGAALYGAGWDRSMAADDDAVVARELPMFRSFEPERASEAQGPVLVTVGELSPAGRHDAARALRDRLDYPVTVIPGAVHFVQHDRPAQYARLIRATHASLGRTADRL